ncbi:MAG: 2-isopropylmalate synthase [Leptospiraceae bacterium]|nr:2-isopropylmalate synthase [Leptospiraceae bacterium]MDW7975852.1 alpha-isopropylmalate synthase regulatory domain-containing protein [Leptospiraceae bacterium]
MNVNRNYDYVEIMDTTLRDGEQMDGVSYSTFEKLQIAKFLLEKLQVDRIEIASARVSKGEFETVKEIFDWAKTKNLQDRIEILGFVDYKSSVDWIEEAGGRVINLLTKGSKKHCEYQLGKTLQEHLKDIEKTIQYAYDRNFIIHVYLEDWSGGYLYSRDYVEEMLRALIQMPISRFMFPDTLGIMEPDEVREGIDWALQLFPKLEIDFHGHNDYDLATANSLAAIKAGAKGIHVAVNGMGERAGNTPLEAVVTAIHDKLKKRTRINEKAITDASRLVETFSRKRIAPNHPIVGQDVYTQTAGIHADGDKKYNLYANPILPERFGRQRYYSLGKLSGRASISNNLKMLGIELSPEKELILLERIKELGEKKATVTIDDLPFLIEDLFGGIQVIYIKVKELEIVTKLHDNPIAKVLLNYLENDYYAEASGDGGYDAFMNAIRKISEMNQMSIAELTDYEVRIPPGGRTDALVETVITWRSPFDGTIFRTVGVDSDQLLAAVKATEKMLNRLYLISQNQKSMSPISEEIKLS